MAATIRSYEKRLLKNGTAAGPVTQEMIDLAKELYDWACRSQGVPDDKWGWSDFLPIARKELKDKGRKAI